MAYTGRAPSQAPITSADINDGIVEPADLSTGAPSWTAGGAVTLPYNGSNKLATTSTGIDVTGTVTADGLEISAATAYLDLKNSDGEDFDTRLASYGTYSALTNVVGSHYVQTGATPLNRIQVANNGDISFYEDTGTTAKFFWDASAESLGIGTSSPTYPLDVNGAAKLGGLAIGTGSFPKTLSINKDGGGSQMGIDIHNVGTATGDDCVISFETQASREWTLGLDRSAASFNISKGSTLTSDPKLVINDSGNVGIGTDSPYSKLHVIGGAATVTITDAIASSSSTSTVLFRNLDGNSVYRDIAKIKGSSAGNGGYGNIIFETAFNNSLAERMRIDSSGNLLVGTTLAPGQRCHIDSGAGTSVLRLNSNATSFTATQFVYNQAVQVGTITCTTTTTAYNTSSDYRLKEDWQPMTGSIDRLKALNPVNFAWKVDGSRVDGFLAHEAQEIVPEAVSGTKDAVEAIGNITDAEGTVVQENVTEPAELSEGQTWTKTEDRPVYQGIDQAKLVPLLTAALQEAVSKIEALETRIAALEA